MNSSSLYSQEGAAAEAPFEHSATPLASVIISTRNRKDELCRAIESVLRQTISAEIVVMDDASEDGTAALVEERFTGVRVIRSESRLGLIAQRNRAARAARGTYIFSLDDDAIFVEPDTLERAVTLFDHPRVGAVAMPIVNILEERRLPLGVRAPGTPGFWITNTYIGCAHAIRRDLFLKLNGYEDALFQWGEEENFCIKLYANGYVVRLGDCGLTEHYLNPVGRHKRAKNVWIYRNSILNTWFYAPLWTVPALWVADSARWLLYGIVKRRRELHIILEGLARGYWWALSHPSARAAVPYRSYMFYLRLKAAKMKKFTEIEPNLPRLTEPKK